MASQPGTETARLDVGELNVEVRASTAADVPVLLSLIRSMAEFEKLDVSTTEEELRDALFGDQPAARALLICVDGAPIGYVTYFYSFTSMMGGRALWLEDLYVGPDFRGKGIGRAMMSHLAQIAVERKCARFEWTVLDWNTRAIEFYERLGAEVLPDWRICRVRGDAMRSIANGAR